VPRRAGVLARGVATSEIIDVYDEAILAPYGIFGILRLTFSGKNVYNLLMYVRSRPVTEISC